MSKISSVPADGMVAAHLFVRGAPEDDEDEEDDDKKHENDEEEEDDEGEGYSE